MTMKNVKMTEGTYHNLVHIHNKLRRFGESHYLSDTVNILCKEFNINSDSRKEIVKQYKDRRKIANKMVEDEFENVKDRYKNGKTVLDSFVINYQPDGSKCIISTGYSLEHEKEVFSIDIDSSDGCSEGFFQFKIPIECKDLKKAMRIFYNYKLVKQEDREFPDFGKHGIVWLGKMLDRYGNIYTDLDEHWGLARTIIDCE